MLKRLENKDVDSVCAFLSGNAVSVRIKANLKAYKCDFDFCKFWAQYDDFNNITAVISEINGVCTLDYIKNADCEELLSLLHFIGFSALFLDKDKADEIGLKYDKSGDILIFGGDISASYETDSFCDMKSAFALISDNEGESVEKLDYLEWLSDFTYKSNRGAARLRAVTEKNKVMALAMTSAESENAAIISGVFTDKEKRKQGLGERVLLSLSKSLSDDYKKIYIMTAEEKLTRYYEKRGFRKCGCWAEVKNNV